MRVLTVVQRYNAISEPWLGRMVADLGPECVGVAGRTLAQGPSNIPDVPFMRLRTRNILHRALPKGLRKYSPLRPASLIVSFARKQNADRILCHFGTVAVEYREAWERLDLPLYVYFHGYDLVFGLREQEGAGRPIHAADYKDRILELSERATFIANSRFSAAKLVEAGVSPDRIKVNYLGVQTPPTIARTPTERPVVLYVGRFVDCKGPDLTILAFNRLRSSGNDAELVMVGDGPLRSTCQALAADSPYASDICLPGLEDHSKVRQRIAAASVFSMHSIKGPMSGQEEAFGVAFLDAMAAGLPVVTGRSGGVPEIVDHGVTGMLFEPGDVDAHANCLAQLIRQPEMASAMGEAGRTKVGAQFSQQQSIADLRKILSGD